MSVAAITQRMNAEEFFAWCQRPEHRDRHFELDRGEVVEVSWPGERHGFVCHNTNRILGNYAFQRRRGYVLSNDTGVILERDPDTVRGPDLVYYEQARRYNDLRPGYCITPPLLAVEVLSPNDSWGKVTRRITQFLGQGICVVWIVDPEEQSLTVCRPNQLPQVLDGDDELIGDPELPEFRCRVADIYYMSGEEAAAVAAGRVE